MAEPHARPFALIPLINVDATLATGEGIQAAHDYASAMHREGCRWIHLHAPQSVQDNPGQVKRLVHALQSSFEIELTAGVTDQATLDAARHTDAHRVVVEASADRQWLASVLAESRSSKDLMVAIDASQGFERLTELEVAGAHSFIVRNAHDHLRGHDLEVLRTIGDSIQQAGGGSFVLTGGVRHLEDLHKVAELQRHGMSGAIVGAALASGAFTYQEAVATLEARFDPYQWGPARP